jgi:uncharacterized protein YjbI with pentapeptide repeats
MLGLHFEDCNSFLLELHFEECMLNLSSFYQLSLKNTMFKTCSLQEVDFTECNLTKAQFSACDLLSAIFYRTILEAADLSSASNFNIDPENNRIQKAKFALTDLPGLLVKYNLKIS